MMQLTAYASRCLLVMATGVASPTVFAEAANSITTTDRIVSLAPHATEYLFFLGAGDRLVGAVEYSDYPEAAKQVPRIGGYQTISLEKIASLSPTLVVIWPSGNPASIYDSLKQRNTPLFETEPHKLDDIAQELRSLSKQLHLDSNAEGKTVAFEQAIQALRDKYSQQPVVSVFYQVWEKPLYTLGGTHFFNDLLAVCGGKNVYADVMEPAPIVSMESVLARQPQVILSSSRHGDASLEEWRENWQRWAQMPAVKNQQMFYVDADVFTRPTPRAVDAATALCAYLEGARKNAPRP